MRADDAFTFHVILMGVNFARCFGRVVYQVKVTKRPSGHLRAGAVPGQSIASCYMPVVASPLHGGSATSLRLTTLSSLKAG